MPSKLYDAILTAALDEFARVGYNATTTSAIADRALGGATNRMNLGKRLICDRGPVGGVWAAPA